MDKSKKTQWFGTFLQRTMLWIRLRSWKRTTSAESCHRLRQTPSWSLHSDEKTKPRMSLILVGITGWVETITIEISNTSSNEVWDANPDPHLNWVFNRGKQSSEHYTVRTNVCSWTGWGTWWTGEVQCCDGFNVKAKVSTLSPLPKPFPSLFWWIERAWQKACHCPGW